MSELKDLGCILNIDVVQQFLSLKGLSVIDAGCGAMTFSKQLADKAAQVLAIDPDAHQAKSNREKDLPANIRFVETGADQLPIEDASVDGVFFSYSLHHVPSELFADVFSEVTRVIRPGGFLYVIEPIDCPLNTVMRIFHDEESVRAGAQIALQTYAVDKFETCKEVTYHSWRQFESYEDFALQFCSKTFNSGYTEADVRQPKVKETFERLGAPDYKFMAPKRVMCLKGLNAKQN